MAKSYRFSFSGEKLSDEDREEQDRQTRSLAGMAVTLMVLVISVFLMRELQAQSAIEDCLASGSRTCDPIIARLL